MEKQKTTIEVNPETKATEITTEVTSVAKEEQKTGQKITVPSTEELVRRAAISLIGGLPRLKAMAVDLPHRALVRAIIATIDLPTEGIPVLLKTDEEKQFFLLGQRLIADRFILTQNHVAQEMKKIQEQKLKEQQALETTKTEEIKQEIKGEVNEQQPNQQQ